VPVILTDANLWVALHDTRDAWHSESVRFFERVLNAAVPMHAPALLLVEVACSIARRSRSERVGRAVAGKLHSQPLLSFAQMDDALVVSAMECGSRLFLKAGDAFYAAVAVRAHAQLVTWDDQFAERAGGMTPTAWLAANP